MKKYFFMLLACVAMLTSCSNDDITIRSTTNFRINPATVVAPFSNAEWTPGDLESFNTGYQLRVRLLIYNSEGLLQNEDVQYFSNYSVVMNSSMLLPEGDYKAIAITDVASKNSGSGVAEFWVLSNYERLADTYIEDAGYIGGQTKILGIAEKNFTVSNDNPGEISIDVQPAGALFFIYYINIREYDFVESYYLSTAKIGSGYLFTSDGSYDVSAENHDGSFDWYISHIDVADFESNIHNVYDYEFVLPVNNMNLKFQYDTATDSGDLTNVMTINPKAGDAWYFEIDLEAFTYSYYLLNGTDTRANKNIVFKTTESAYQAPTNQVKRIYLKDIQ